MLLEHLDGSKNNKMNQKRDEWLKGIKKGHLLVLEQVCDLKGANNMPVSFITMAKHALANIYKLSESTRAMIRELDLYTTLQGEFLAERTNSQKSLDNDD